MNEHQSPMPRSAILPDALAIPPGASRSYLLEDRRILICNLEGILYALEDRCTHDDGALGEVALEGCAVTCWRHGARFDVRDGRALTLPAQIPIPSFPVAIQDGQVVVYLSPAVDPGSPPPWVAWLP